jgi:mannosyltransferase OCH1-like enzyme
MFFLNRNVLNRNIRNVNAFNGANIKNTNMLHARQVTQVTQETQGTQGTQGTQARQLSPREARVFISKKHLEEEESKRKIYAMPYIPSKTHYSPVIPLTIYQTWYTKDLPPSMQKNVDKLKTQNLEFSYQLYDDNDSREFIRINFSPDVLHAYDMLIPGAYKADLWRYCVLYKNGGMYMDIKVSCINGFKLIELCESEHYALDREGHNSFNTQIPIYNALMVCKKNNPFLLEAIYKIVKNVQIKYRGFNPLYPTGPGMLSEVIQEIKMKGVNPNLNTDIYHYYDGTGLVYRDRFIISLTYPGYRNDQSELNKKINKKTYTNHWLQNNIYANTEEAK